MIKQKTNKKEEALKYHKIDIINKFVEFYLEYGFIPNSKDFNRAPRDRYPHTSTIVYWFGSFKKAKNNAEKEIKKRGMQKIHQQEPDLF